MRLGVHSVFLDLDDIYWAFTGFLARFRPLASRCCVQGGGGRGSMAGCPWLVLLVRHDRSLHSRRSRLKAAAVEHLLLSSRDYFKGGGGSSCLLSPPMILLREMPLFFFSFYQNVLILNDLDATSRSLPRPTVLLSCLYSKFHIDIYQYSILLSGFFNHIGFFLVLGY